MSPWSEIRLASWSLGKTGFPGWGDMQRLLDLRLPGQRHRAQVFSWEEPTAMEG